MTMFQSNSAIERATGMTFDEWLAFNGYGEHEATSLTLRNLTQLERRNGKQSGLTDAEELERLDNLDRYVKHGYAFERPADDSEICENDD